MSDKPRNLRHHQLSELWKRLNENQGVALATELMDLIEILLNDDDQN